MVDRTTLIPATPLTREEVHATLAAQKNGVVSQADEVTAIRFQQAINCCGLTSVAYALTVLDCPTSVDDLFLTVGVDVESAVGDGMTLSEIYDLTSRYIIREKLPLFLECYHFDTDTTSVDGFREACADEGASGLDDLIIFNFNTGIAHAWPTGGCGHFSLLVALESATDRVIMSDVNSKKYPPYWSIPVSQMYAAMNDNDSCGRARGAIRFGRLDKTVSRPVEGLKPSLVDWTAPPDAYTAANLSSYIPERWDEVLGVRNMEGPSVLASAMRLLEGDDAPTARLDYLMRVLQESYTGHLDNFCGARKVAEMATRLHDKGETKAVCSVKKMRSFSAGALRAALEEVGCGETGVAVLVAYDHNVAMGFEVIPPDTSGTKFFTHGTRSWSLLAAFDKAAKDGDVEGLVVAPAHHVIIVGRLWSTSLERMAAAMRAVGGGECSLAVLDRR